MKNFDEIIGQNHIKEHFQNAILKNTINHAYIISGEKSSGKFLLANAFAAAIQCETKTGKPCMQCRSCKMAMTNNHPDIIEVTHEKPNIISIDEIRNQLVNDMYIKPYCSEKKVYIIDEAEKMNLQAQNALLKTLEEPPSYAVILLITNNVTTFLDTILSRCVTLSMRPVETEKIKRVLIDEVKLPDYRASTYANFARGNVGKAINLSMNDDFLKLKTTITDLLRNIDELSAQKLMDYINGFAEIKDDYEEILNLIMMWYRDVAIYKATKSKKRVVFQEEIDAVKKTSFALSFENIEKILKLIEETRKKIKANVAFELAMEILLVEISHT